MSVFWREVPDISNIYILLFLLMLGMISSLISVSGGGRAFGEWARQRVRTRSGAQLITVLLGITIFILIFTWVLTSIIGDLGTGKYLASLVSGNMSPSYLPMILFVVSGAMAFATGTSWGTFSIMLPIAADMGMAADTAIMLPMMAAVLAGAVFGDHCSPISDTTILSSTGASCHHIDHINSQFPYAMSIAVVAALGYLVMGITQSISAGFVSSLVAFLILIIAMWVSSRKLRRWGVAG